MRASGLLATLALGACFRTSGEPPISGVAETHYAIPVRRQDAIARLATVRCQRADACGRIGPSGRHATAVQCLRDVEHEAMDALDELRCDLIAAEDLDRCVDEIARAPCALEITHTEQMPACVRGRLCR